MSSSSVTRRAWIVATSCVGGVEAMKDQGFCKWNYTMKSLTKINFKNSISQAKKNFSFMNFSDVVRELAEKPKQAEESMRQVMYFSCWGPN